MLFAEPSFPQRKVDMAKQSKALLVAALLGFVVTIFTGTAHRLSPASDFCVVAKSLI